MMTQPRPRRKRRPKPQQVICPNCGREGHLRRYLDGTGLVVHETQPGALGAVEITDSCYLTEQMDALEV